MCVCVNKGHTAAAFAIKPVSSSLVFISWLFTFSSDTACQTSPQDIPQKRTKKKKNQNNPHNPTTLPQPASLGEAAAREQRRGEKTEAAATAS